MTDVERLLFDDEALKEETTKLYEEHCKTHDTPPTKPLDKKKAFEKIRKDIESFERKQKLKEQEAKNQRTEFSSSNKKEDTDKDKYSSSSRRRKDDDEDRGYSYWDSRSSKKDKDPLKEYHKKQLKNLKEMVDLIIEEEDDMIFKGKAGFGVANDVLNMHSRLRKRRLLEIEYDENYSRKEAEDLHELKHDVYRSYRKLRWLVTLKLNPYTS